MTGHSRRSNRGGDCKKKLLQAWQMSDLKICPGHQIVSTRSKALSTLKVLSYYEMYVFFSMHRPIVTTRRPSATSRFISELNLFGIFNGQWVF